MAHDDRGQCPASLILERKSETYAPVSDDAKQPSHPANIDTVNIGVNWGNSKAQFRTHCCAEPAPQGNRRFQAAVKARWRVSGR